MATKADFTEAEWQTLEWAVSDTMTYLSLADPGVWDTFKEAKGRPSTWPRSRDPARTPSSASSRARGR